MRIMALIQSQYRVFLSPWIPHIALVESVICVNINFLFSEINIQKNNCWDIWKWHVYSLKILPNCIPDDYHFLSPLPMWSDPVSPHPRQPSVLSPFFNFKYSDSVRMTSWISLLPNDVEHLHVLFLPCEYIV